MQIASRQPLWFIPRGETTVEVEITPETGLYICFRASSGPDEISVVSWGDGVVAEYFHGPGTDEVTLEHDYATYGHYRITLQGVHAIGFRYLSYGEPHAYDNAVLSVVDEAAQITGNRSGAYLGAANIRRFIAPNCCAMGERDFADCPNLEEVVLGAVEIYYDGTFQNCTNLRSFTATKSWTCWNSVWAGCSSLAELKLGAVNQFAYGVFSETPLLKDIWIDNKTVEQIAQRAEEGNIVAGYGASFPWGAAPDCRFHGTNGIILGNGTILP